MKKTCFLTVALSILVAVSGLVGCGGSSSDGEPSLNTPPTLSNGSPTGVITTGTTSTTLSLTTDKTAICKYTTTPGVIYSSIDDTFTTTGGTTHSNTITGLTAGSLYAYYIRCADIAGNQNTVDYVISFSVANASPPNPVVDLGDYWLFYGDSETAGRADEVYTKSQVTAFESIWSSTFASPPNSYISGVGGSSLLQSQGRYESRNDRDLATFMHFQESGSQRAGQTTATEFANTFEAFVRKIAAESPRAIISTETAYSFLSDERWVPFNDAMRLKIELLAQEGITVHVAEVDRNIKVLISQTSLYSVILSDDTHYTGLGNLMIAVSMYDALGFDVTALDLSGVPDTEVSAIDKQLIIDIVSAGTNLGLESGDPKNQPLLQMDEFSYQGAFIIPGDQYGESNANYSTGQIEYNPWNHSLFIVGHNRDDAIAEFAIPELVNSVNLNNLNIAQAPLQNFYRILDRTPDSNPQNINVITGMKLIGNQMLINGIEYYDASSWATHTTAVIRDTSNLSNSLIDGFFELQGAAHVAGWISVIPEEWQAILGGEYISGNASNYPIASRHSNGPSAFVFDPSSMLDSSPTTEVPTTVLMDFPLSNGLHDDRYNSSLQNDLWTAVSRSEHGFIVPNTRTYLTIGSSGGHEFGLGYKATQDTGHLCGGPCSLVAADNYNYYWLWDVNDLLDVKNGIIQPYEMRPYAYGEFEVPFQTDVRNNNEPEIHYIRGANFDSQTGTLYITIYGADSRGAYSTNPVIAVYKLNGYVPPG